MALAVVARYHCRFVWANDQPEGKRPKWGFIANQTGAAIRFKLDTRTASFRVEAGGLPATATQAQARACSPLWRCCFSCSRVG